MISCTIWSWTEPVEKVSISKIASHFTQLICDAVYLQLIEKFLVSNASSAEFKVCAWHAITMLSKLCYDLSVPAKYCAKASFSTMTIVTMCCRLSWNVVWHLEHACGDMRYVFMCVQHQHMATPQSGVLLTRNLQRRCFDLGKIPPRTLASVNSTNSAVLKAPANVLLWSPLSVCSLWSGEPRIITGFLFLGGRLGAQSWSRIYVSLFSKYSHVCLWAWPSVWVFVSVWEYRHFNYVTPVCICVSVNGETPPYWPRCLWKQDHESKPSEALKLNRSALWLHWIGRTGTLALHLCIVELSALIFTEFEYSTHRWTKPQQHCKVCTMYKIFAQHEEPALPTE